MHTEGDIVIANSIRLPVRSLSPMCLNECNAHIVTLFDILIGDRSRFFFSLPPLQNSNGSPSAGVLNTQG